MKLEVDHHPIGDKLHRLDVRHGGQLIGEYERSQVEDIDRKCEEIQAAAEFLLAVHRKHGEFKVRWVDERREKVVCVRDLEVAVIPEEFWRRRASAGVGGRRPRSSPEGTHWALAVRRGPRVSTL